MYYKYKYMYNICTSVCTYVSTANTRTQLYVTICIHIYIDYT